MSVDFAPLVGPADRPAASACCCSRSGCSVRRRERRRRPAVAARPQRPALLPVRRRHAVLVRLAAPLAEPQSRSAEDRRLLPRRRRTPAWPWRWPSWRSRWRGSSLEPRTQNREPRALNPVRGLAPLSRAGRLNRVAGRPYHPPVTFRGRAAGRVRPPAGRATALLAARVRPRAGDRPLRAVADPARQTAPHRAHVRALGRALRLSPGDIAEHCAAEHESAVLATLARPGFRADSRWVSTMAGIPLDEVNVTLQRLLRKRMMTMSGRAIWQRAGEETRG